MRGICSRKEAEDLITQGRLKIDNKVHLNVGTRLPLYTKNLVIDNRPLQPFHAWDWKPKLWVHYKMPEILISHKDDRNRKTLFPILKEMLAKDRQANPLLSVGRLDYMSEGILLITNSGELARHMELPESGYSRKYQVRIHGSVTDQKIKAIRHGVKIDGVLYDGMEFSLLRSNQANHIVSVTLKEGKNREVRNIFAFFNWQVSKLKRVQYGPYHLQDIPKGGLLEVPLKGKLKEWYHQTRQLLVQEELYHDHYYATHPYPVVADYTKRM